MSGDAGDDQLFRFDTSKMSALLDKHPWVSEPKYFKRVKLSALAALKMLQHAIRGVEAGKTKSANGSPLEIMGLLLGRPSLTEADVLIVLDCYALPVEGTETKVMADDEKIAAHMANLSDQLEKTHNERLVGWYHSHPFDVGANSNCFLSAIDIQTQLMWQNGLDKKWVAIVVDPLRALAKNVPEMMAFRAYPPDFKPPEGQAPDGTFTGDDIAKQTRWGKAYSRYYVLPIQLFVSKPGRQLLQVMSQKQLWIRSLAAAAVVDPENSSQLADRLSSIADQIEAIDLSKGSMMSGGFAPAKKGEKDAKVDELEKVGNLAKELSAELTNAELQQLAKHSHLNFKPSS